MGDISEVTGAAELTWQLEVVVQVYCDRGEVMAGDVLVMVPCEDTNMAGTPPHGKLDPPPLPSALSLD
jgi:hypothetical protein